MKEKLYLRLKSVFLFPMLFVLLMAMSMVGQSQNVTVSTDKDDYWPGEWVIISGTGWGGDASVQIALTHVEPSIPDHSHESWLVTPDGNGDIHYEWFVEEQEFGTSFQLDALGLTSGLTATVFFTDALCANFAIVDPANVTYPTQPATFTVTPSVSGAGVTFQWYLKPVGGGGFGPIAGATSASYTVPSVTSGMSGNDYKCEVTYACGGGNSPRVKTSNFGVLTVAPPASAPPSTPICPGDITVNNVVDVCGAVVTYAAVTATGTPTPVITYSTASGSLFPIGTTVVTVTATNDAGESTCSFNVTVVDNQFPDISILFPATYTVACVSEAVPPTLPIATDNCGPINGVWVSTVDSEVGLPCEGTRTYNYSYTDPSGNVTNWSYVYTIEVEDFSIPATTNSSTVACADLATAEAVTLPEVLSNCGAVLTASAPVQNSALTDTYVDCEGTISYTWTYTDCEGNTHDWTYTYTIEVEDFSIPATTNSSTVECAVSAKAEDVVLPVVTSNCGATITPTGPVINKGGNDTYVDCEGTISYTWTYTDCEGNTHDWTYTYTVDDTQAPTVVTKPVTVTLDMTGNISITPSQVNNGTTDNCSGTLTYSLNQSAFTCADVPSKTVSLTAKDCAGNSASADALVTVNQRPTKLTIGGFFLIANYSDPITLTATLKDAATSTPLAGKDVKFSFGTQQATGTTNASGVATVTIVINQPAGSYTLTASYAGACPFIATSTTKGLLVTPEKACATYTGVMSASTGSVNSSKATLLLSATIVDDSDGSRGDITKAVVNFLANGVLIKSIPVGIVNNGDYTVGSAATQWTYDIGAQDGATVTIATVITGGYYMNKLSMDCFDITEVTIYKPSAEFITGGGYLILQPGKQAGTLKADDNSKTNFGFNVKYNKKGTSLQGNINIITRKTTSDWNANLNEGAGGYEDVTHKIQIKGTALSTLAVNTTNGTAEFTGKAVAQDITDPLNVVSVGGNFVIKAVMTDKGEPGTADMLSLTIFDKNGGVYFSSRWENNQPTQQLLAAGNLKTSANSSLKSAEIGSQISPMATTSEPVLNVYPNPFSARLNIEFSSVNATNARLDIYSITGAKLETLWDGPISAGVQYKVEYLPRLSGSQMVFYHLTMDGKTQIGKAIYNERK